MTKREKLYLTLFIIMTLLFLFSIPVKVAYPQEAHVGAQIVFHVDHEAAPGRYVLEPTDVRIAYTVQPTEGSHPAPMQISSTALCRPYNEGPKYFLRCGMDRYSVSGIALIPREAQ